MRVYLLLVVALVASAQNRKVTEEEVVRVHKSTLLIDSHNDVTSNTVEGFDIGPRSSSGHTDLARMREGVSAQFAPLCSELCQGITPPIARFR
jgi:membrane dipeptidase